MLYFASQRLHVLLPSDAHFTCVLTTRTTWRRECRSSKQLWNPAWFCWKTSRYRCSFSSIHATTRRPSYVRPGGLEKTDDQFFIQPLFEPILSAPAHPRGSSRFHRRKMIVRDYSSGSATPLLDLFHVSLLFVSSTSRASPTYLLGALDHFSHSPDRSSRIFTADTSVVGTSLLRPRYCARLDA